jgi:hypothetical protein
MRGIFSGDLALYVHADDVRQITAAVHFKREFSIPRLVLVGGSDAPLVADLLRDNSVSVLIARLHSLPRFEDDPVDRPFTLPKLLEDEGVLYALEGSGNMEAMSARNLPGSSGWMPASEASRPARMRRCSCPLGMPSTCAQTA